MRVLYIDIDCCRADHLGCNGYRASTGRDVTPTIDRIAAEGMTFAGCHTSNSPCLPSRAALFTGRFGFQNGIVAHHGPGERLRPNNISSRQDPDRPFLVGHLRAHGLRTVAFSSFHDRHQAWWWTAGWDEIHTNRKRGQETADEIAGPALAWLEENATSDGWFVDVHMWDAHSHYRAPKEWLTKFFGHPAPQFPDAEAVERNLSIYGPRSARDLWTGHGNGETRPDTLHPEGVYSLADAKRLIDLYDGSIAHVDHWVGRIVDLLERKGVLDETAIIVSADHGDSFGEHGQYMDHGIANVAVHNIPLVIRWPGRPARGRCDALVYNVDLCPTLCDLLGIPTPAGWDGATFVDALDGNPFDGWPYLVYDHGIYTFSRAVRTRDWTLIAMLHPGLYPYDAPFLLHDLVADPHQQANLADERPDKRGELAALLAEWRLGQVRKGGVPDPLEEMVPHGPFIYYDPARMDARLRRTGRTKEADELRARLAGIRKDTWRA